MTSRLFVYGTLRSDVCNSMFHLLAREATFVGRGQVQGRLFNLGGYPGLVLCHDHGSWVQGEVYALANPAETLTRLDDYERCGPNDPEPHQYERVEKDVLLESGANDRAWVYVYRGSTADTKQILSGDYLDEAP